MIFSLLNVRKKTAASLAGIAIGALCLWGVAMWQDLSIGQLASILLAILLLLGGVMLTALLLISVIKLGAYCWQVATGKRAGSTGSGSNKRPADAADDASKKPGDDLRT